MSSLSRSCLYHGVKWQYRILDHIASDKTHNCSAAYKAKIVHHEVFRTGPQYALIKLLTSSSSSTERENIYREHRTYLLDGVSSAKCFRGIYDFVENGEEDVTNGFLAMEWLDSTLAAEQYRPNKTTFALILAVLQAALDSCTILNRQGYINTDYKSANVLLSNVGTENIIAKIGDLGLVFPNGKRYNAQPVALRAPEVFLGHPCSEPSQIWAIAAMLLCWIKPGLLGAWDSPHPLIDTTWSLAKLLRLFPNWRLPSDESITGDVLKATVKTALRISAEESDLQSLEPLEATIRKIEAPLELQELLLSMLVIDTQLRPCPVKVQASRQFAAFKSLVKSRL